MKPRETSASVQRPMKRPLWETSASEMTGAILRVKAMRMADAAQALLYYQYFGCENLKCTYNKPAANIRVMKIFFDSGTLSCQRDAVGRRRMTISEAMLKAPCARMMSFTS